MTDNRPATVGDLNAALMVVVITTATPDVLVGLCSAGEAATRSARKAVG